MLQGLEIKARRLHSRMKQNEFAAKLGISRQFLSRLETGRERASEKLEARYNDIFGTKRLININDFERGVECPYCHSTSPLELLNDPEDELDKIYRCGCEDCAKVFTIGQSWGLHYR